MPNNLKLTDERNYFKPFSYPWSYDAWLKHEKSHWLFTEVPLHEDVKDWNTKLNENEKYFITQIFRFFTQCYDSETDILGEMGWINIMDYVNNPSELKIAQINDNSEIEFVYPLAKHKSYYFGDMYAYKDQKGYIDLLVTPNHKMVYTYNGKWKQDKAKDFNPFQGIKILRSAKKSIGTKTKLTPLEKIWIVFQADGNVKNDVDGSKLGFIPHRFTFKKQRKIDYFRLIINESGLEYSETIENRPDGQYTTFYIHSPIRMDKNFDWINLNKITSDWCLEFLNELYKWDGTYVEEESGIRYKYFNTNKQAIDIVQAIVAMAGIYHGFTNSSDNRNELYKDCPSISWNLYKLPEIDGQAIKRGTSIEKYDGMVYCVTVPSGKIIVRRNNKISICGNSDIDVAGGYVDNYLPIFTQTEVRMMLLGFAGREAMHIASYSHLIETLGLPERIYNEFNDYEAMKAKHNYFKEMSILDRKSIAQQIAAFSAFTEGLALFSSFAMLLNFVRHGKLKGMGQIITWVALDETMHFEAMIKLFRTFIEENRHIWKDDLKHEIYEIAKKMVELEEKFIDLAFSMGPMENLTADDVKIYIKYICDRRLISLGLKGIFKVKKNPLRWMEEMINAPVHTNFFENKSTDYAKGALTGSWENVWT